MRGRGRAVGARIVVCVPSRVPVVVPDTWEREARAGVLAYDHMHYVVYMYCTPENSKMFHVASICLYPGTLRRTTCLFYRHPVLKISAYPV